MSLTDDIGDIISRLIALTILARDFNEIDAQYFSYLLDEIEVDMGA